MADAAHLAAMSDRLRADLADQRGGPMLVAHHPPPVPGAPDVDGLATVLADRSRLVLVGTVDEVVRAMAAGRVSVLPGGERLGRLEACYVDPAARRIGLGRRLVQAELEWFARQGCVGADGIALPGDRAAKSFFEGTGFKARLLVMHRPVGPA